MGYIPGGTGQQTTSITDYWGDKRNNIIYSLHGRRYQQKNPTEYPERHKSLVQQIW